MTDHPVVPAGDDVTRQVIGNHPRLMVVAVRFQRDGAIGADHSHPHVQSTYVQSGHFTFTLDGTGTDPGPGDCLLIPSGARHGCVCREPGQLIDTFTPRRDAFL